MAMEFYRGSTPTIRFYPQDGLRVENLGEPVVAISQELVTLTFENNVDGEEDRVTIDTANNCIAVSLTETESIQLADGVATYAQVTWYQYAEQSDPEADPVISDVLKFPQHQITILPSILDLILPEDEEVPEEDPEEELDYDTEDPIGTLVVDDGDGLEYYVPDYQEYYDDTTETEPLESYPYSEGIVQPIGDWDPNE